MNKIYFLRHAKAPKHPELLYTMDLLDKEGLRFARELAMSNVSLGEVIVSSPHKRAKDTAQIISNIRGLPLEVVSDWREAHRGVFQERPYKEFLEEWSKFNLSYDYIPPGGESVNQLRKRIVSGLDSLLSVKKDILCVTHAGLIANILMMLYGFEFDKSLPSPGKMAILGIENDRFTLNPQDNSYLEITKELVVPVRRIYEFK